MILRQFVSWCSVFFPIQFGLGPQHAIRPTKRIRSSLVQTVSHPEPRKTGSPAIAGAVSIDMARVATVMLVSSLLPPTPVDIILWQRVATVQRQEGLSGDE